MSNLKICPVCQFSVSTPIFDGDHQTLATLGWPQSREEAMSMPTYRLDYHQCVKCTHIWNREFSYDAIPYSTNPNRMFNQGWTWKDHLEQTAEFFITYLPDQPIVIDIGCGEGHFVRGIAEKLKNSGKFLGFDPSITNQKSANVEFRNSLFEPSRHMQTLEPHGLIMRHVLEHLANPSGFADELAWYSNKVPHDIYFLAEMPCVDKMLSTNRIVDFFYEHPSQFTTESFLTLLEKAGKIVHFDHGYDGEVVYGIVKLCAPTKLRATELKSKKFFENSNKARTKITQQIEKLVAEGKRLAIWGGTGKAAAFMHYYDVTSEKVEIVVDSDPEKVGGFVPKTGQLIQAKEILLNHPIDVLIIPSQWRAADIMLEIQSLDVHFTQILAEAQGELRPVNSRISSNDDLVTTY